MRMVLGVCAACLLAVVLTLTFSAGVEASTDRDSVSDSVLQTPVIEKTAPVDLRREHTFIEDYIPTYRHCECSTRVTRSKKVLRCRGGTCRV